MNDFIMNTLSPVLQVILLGVLSAVLGIVTTYLRTKFNLEIGAEKVAAIEKAAMAAVLSVEGRAMRKLSESGEKWVSEMKHAEAINRLLAEAPDLTPDQAKKCVDMAVARLPKIGTGK